MASCVVAAMTLSSVALPPYLSPLGSPQTFTITVDPRNDANGTTASAEVWIRRIVADGVLQNANMLERSGDWELLWDPAYPALHNPSRAGRASVSFEASHAIIEFIPSASPGHVVVKAGDQVLQTPDLHGAEMAVHRVAGSPAPAVPRWAVVGISAGLILWACLLCPWRSPRREEVWLTSYLILIHAAIWPVQWIGTNEDSAAYAMGFASNVRGIPHFFPPGYSIFLAIADAVPGMGQGSAATLLQHGMMILTLLWLRRLLLMVTPRALASSWLVFVSVLPPSLFLPQMIQSENLAVFGMTAALYFGVRTATGGAAGAMLLSGASLAAAVLARVVPATMAPALLILQYIHAPGTARRRGATILAVASAVTLAPAAWFAVHGYGPGLTSGAGGHLFNRAVFEQKLLDPQGATTARVLEMLPGTDLRELHHWDLHGRLAEKGLAVLTPDGRYLDQAGTLIRGVAVEAVMTQPFQFVLFSFHLAWRTLFADPSDQIHWFARSRDLPPEVAQVVSRFLGPEVVDRRRVETPRPWATPVSAIQWRLNLDWWFNQVWVPLCWLAVIGAVCAPFCRRPLLGIALAWIPAGYLVACGFVEYFLPRYNVGVTPFITATAMLPIGMLASRLGRKSHKPPSVSSAGDTATLDPPA
jgi:hypothetical protein